MSELRKSSESLEVLPRAEPQRTPSQVQNQARGNEKHEDTMICGDQSTHKATRRQIRRLQMLSVNFQEHLPDSIAPPPGRRVLADHSSPLIF